MSFWCLYLPKKTRASYHVAVKDEKTVEEKKKFWCLYLPKKKLGIVSCHRRRRKYGGEEEGEEEEEEEEGRGLFTSVRSTPHTPFCAFPKEHCLGSSEASACRLAPKHTRGGPFTTTPSPLYSL